ncbi:MAG: hypothetical protein O2973_04345 [Gemmatimonadetes bacterium]|nr:hypothetical protein [Gemmatimonadota bacterium]
MDTRKVYCSECDREVSLAFTDPPTNPGGQASLSDGDLVCLEMNERCHGHVCPVCRISPEALAVRIAKSGLRPDQHATLHAMCDGCQRETDLMMTRGGYVTCPECGATRMMVRA